MINYPLLKKCSVEEKQKLIFLIHIAKLDNTYKVDTDKMNYTIPELIDRFTIIQGEISSGNDTNKTIYQEAIYIIEQLINKNEINKTVGDDVIKELQNNL